MPAVLGTRVLPPYARERVRLVLPVTAAQPSTAERYGRDARRARDAGFAALRARARTARSPGNRRPAINRRTTCARVRRSPGTGRTPCGFRCSPWCSDSPSTDDPNQYAGTIEGCVPGESSRCVICAPLVCTVNNPRVEAAAGVMVRRIVKVTVTPFPSPPATVKAGRPSIVVRWIWPLTSIDVGCPR